MKRLFFLISLMLASCSDYLRVGQTYQHGNVPQEKTHTNINQPHIPAEELTDPTTISFWVVYVPFLLIVLYITYKTFKTNKK